MAQFLNMYSVDLQKPTGPQPLRQMVCAGDNAANRIGAIVTSDGGTVSLGGSCVGKVVRADGTTVQLSGTISGNRAYVVLDQASCAIAGQIQVAVCWVSGSNVTTLVIAYGSVVSTQTGSPVQPSTPIPDLTQLLAEIENMRTATAAATAAATGALTNFAGAFSETAVYTAGQYVTYTDGKFYRLTADHAANVTWANTSKAAVTTGGELMGLKQAMATENANIMANFAGAFVQATAYPAGTYVTYTDGNLYVFPNGHEANVTWANTTKTQVSVGGELSELKSALTNIVVRTRNNFDSSYLLEANGWTENNGVYSGTASAINTKYGLRGSAYPIQDNFESNQQYTISLKAKTNGSQGTTGNGLSVYFIYTDNSNGSLAIPNSTSIFTSFKLTSATGKTIAGIRFSYGANGNNSWDVKDIQLEKGAYQTEYINYTVPNDQVAREDIGDLRQLVLRKYANSVLKIEESNEPIHITDGSKIDFFPTVTVRRQNLLEPTCQRYLYFSGSAGDYSIISSGSKNANVVDLANIDNLYISGDLSGFNGSVFRYAFTSEYPQIGTQTISSGAINTNTLLAVPNDAKYLIWTTGSTSITSISSSAMLNAGTTAMTYSAYISDLTSVSVTIDKDGQGTDAQTKQADLNGNVIGFVTKDDFYIYSSDAVTTIITYCVDTETAIREISSGGYVTVQGGDDTFSMIIGENQNGALSNTLNIAIGYKNMLSATAKKCIAIGVENMGAASGEQNTAIGYHSLFRVTSGKNNAALGNESLDDLQTGTNNTACGAYALQRAVQGSGNTAVGFGALRGGYNSFDANSTYEYNTGVGYLALSKCKTNYSNVAIGSSSGKTIETGNNNVFVGAGADANASNITNSIALGNSVKTTKSNQMMLGSANITEVVMCGNKKIVFNQDGTVTWEALT